MDKLLIVTFNNETDAFKGLDAIQNLNEEGDIELYAASVLSKDKNGKVAVKTESDEGPMGTAVGMLTGAMLGVLGGPAGMFVGTTAGGYAGLLVDIANAGVDDDFVDEVSKTMLPGKTMIIAEVEEDWETPIDTKMAQFDGQVIRRPRSKVIKEEVAGEWTDFKKEIKDAQTKTKAAAQKTVVSIRQRLNQIQAKTDAKVKAAEDKRKSRSKKLNQAKKLAKEALKP